MRIGLVEFLLILAIASLTIGPQVAFMWCETVERDGRVQPRFVRIEAAE